MNFTNRDFDLADQRSQAERDAGIATARQRLSQGGSKICIDCDKPIEPLRRQAMPSARRCARCQTIHEREVRA